MLGSDDELIGAAAGAKPTTDLKYDVAQHCTEIPNVASEQIKLNYWA